MEVWKNQTSLMNFFKRPFNLWKNAGGGVEYIAVGLGNPGPRYDKTRHNVGFIAVDRIAERAGAEMNSNKFSGICGTCAIGNKKTLLLKPDTFMNESGKAALEAASFYKVPPERVLVIFDDVALPVGKIRIKKRGSHGGHNGIKSVINRLGSEDFPRIKIGVGEKPSRDWDLADWVLSKFNREELEAINAAAEKAAEAAEMIIGGDLDAAMNRYN